MSKEAVRTLRLEVERPADVGELVNLVQNPDGRLGAWGWVTPVDGSILRGGPAGLTYTSPGGVSSYFSTEPMPLAAGSWLSATWRADAGQGAYRVSVDWLDAAGAVIGSTTPSAYYPFTGDDRSEGAHQAPASTAYAQLRFNHYAATSGGFPTAGATMRVNGVTVTAAGSAGELVSTRTNLFPNPSGENGVSGWRIRTGGVLGTTTDSVTGTRCITARKTSDGKGMIVDTSLARVTPSRDYAFQVRTRPHATPRPLVISVAWYDSADRELAVTQIGTGTQTAGAWTPVLGGTATAPTRAVAARLRVRVQGAVEGETHRFDASMAEPGRTVGPYFDGDTADTPQVTYAWTGTPHESPSTATRNQVGTLQPIQWLNILGPTHEIMITREALNLGTLSATVLDSELDPARAETLRPGRRVRLMAVDADDVDQVLYTGWVGLDLSVEYRLLEKTRERRARIALTAVDAVNKLASTPRSEGVATIAELPYVLEGAGVPWSVNGSGDQVPTATVVAYNDNATAADQLAVTRDTVHGYVWVDREGVVQAWDRNLMPATPVLTLDESVYNSGFEVGYSTDTIINSVGVAVLKVIATSGVTEEITLGPFQHQESVAEWGLHHQDYTVAIEASEAAAAAWAQGILSGNAIPQVLVRQCVVPIKTVDHLDRALLDLYDPVTVVNGNAGIDQLERVTKIEHSITATAEGGKWLMTVGFAGEGVAAPSTSVPSPPPRIGDVTGGFDGSLQDVFDEADRLASEAEEAAKSAAFEMAQGKLRWSTLPPGEAPNTVGDVWFQKDAETQDIIGQWEGLGGTSWQAKQLRNEVIANLDAGKLVAGSAFINGLWVLTNFTLGDADTDGVIQSYDFANSPVGVFINKNGIVAKGGKLTGTEVVGGTVTGAVYRTDEDGARVQLSSASNPFQNGQTWGFVQFFADTPGWMPGQAWAIYDSAKGGAQLRLSAPYAVGRAYTDAATIALETTASGGKRLRFNADSYYLGSFGSGVDFRLEGHSTFNLIESSGARLDFELGAVGSGFGATLLDSRDADGAKRELVLRASQVTFDSGPSGTRSFTMGSNYTNPSSPIFLDTGAGTTNPNEGTGFSTRNVEGGRFDIVGVYGENYKICKAWSFVAASDASWKAEVQAVPRASMLSQVRALRPVEYGVKGFDPTVRRTRGLIAQEVAAAMPQGASGEEDGDMGVDLYGVLTTVVGAVQELADRVDALTHPSPPTRQGSNR